MQFTREACIGKSRKLDGQGGKIEGLYQMERYKKLTNQQVYKLTKLVRLDRKMVQKLKKLAVLQDTSVKKLIESALKEVYDLEGG